ncbi:endoribonuclease Dicer-like protein, partial [Euroglyphus maynei]
MNDNKEDTTEDFNLKLRDYQDRIFKKCIKENLIVCLPTGSGKTIIAIELIKYLLPQTLGNYPTKAKRTFFLAPKRVLTLQQYYAIEKFVTAKILMLTGDDEPDKFDKQQWMIRLKENQIFVVTPDILLDILSKGYIKVHNLNLIIFDEMHWAFRNGTEPSNHPYSRIMSIVKAAKNLDKPRILCLSASIFANDSQSILESIDDSLRKIEQLYHARIESGGFSYAHKYKQELLEYNQTFFNIDIGFDFDRLFRIFDASKHISLLKQFQLAFMKIQKTIMGEMGVWFTLEYIKLCCNSLNDNRFEISDVMMKIMKYIDKRIRHWLCEHKGIVYHEHEYQPILMKTDLISILSENDENFTFLKLGFICGSFMKDFLHFDFIHSNSQYLSKLRENQINFIIATSVLEEGIDVPICNVVIRYDGVDNYRAYCQSRGRARHDHSYFYIMTLNSEAKKVRKKIHNYRKIDDLLVNIKSSDYIDCFERESQNKNEDDFFHTDSNNHLLDEDILSIQPYQNGQSTLHPLGSLQLLNRYLMKLPHDLFTQQQMPLELFIKLPTDTKSNDIKYGYIFIFPINSNHAGTVIKGGYFKQKKSAAMHCAFRACKFLIDHGDIDENLNIFQRRFILEQHSSELNIRYVKGIDDEKQFETRRHLNKTSDYFQAIIDFDHNVNTDFIYYLYALEFKAGSFDPTKLGADLQSQLYKPLFISTNESNNHDDNQTIGLLLSQKHPIDF